MNIHVTPVAVEPDLNDELGRELRKRTGARRALVVNNCDEDDSDAMHACLGAAAAHFLVDVLRDGDKIAVAAGRAVNATIKELRRQPELDAGLGAGLSVISLGGGMLRTPFAPQNALDLVDADYNAALLAIALCVPVARVNLCYLPAFAPPARCADLINIVAPHLRKLKADVLLYGCGVVDDAHYLLRMEDPQTQVIRPQAEKLRRVVKQYRGAVVDFCDEFFVAPTVPRDLLDEVRDIVTALRKAAIRIEPLELAKPAERILVAGGRRKLEALALLTDESWAEGPRPTTIVTDSGTATALLS